MGAAEHRFTRDEGLIMELTVVQTELSEIETPLLALALHEGEGALEGRAQQIDQQLGGQISALLGRGELRGKEGETLLLYPAAGAARAERVLLIGAGRAERLDAERIRRIAGTAAKQALRLKASSLTLALPAGERMGAEAAGRAAAEGLVLGAYRFAELKTQNADEPATELERAVFAARSTEEAAALEAGARVGAVLARAENLARTLGNLPGNIATPTYLAETAQRVAREQGMKCTVLGREEMRREKMGALLAVSQGSAQEPKLIVLEHRGGAEGEKPVVLVGKGLTFDAGGISIKPAASMEDMKFDMSGGGAVISAMQAIAELGVKLNVIGIVPSSENLLSGEAMKPGDILTSMLGKTIEVVNTDAEGRLILADALAYAQRYEPAAIVDAATLTGACVIALGHQASAVMGNDESLISELRAAAERVGERVWPLPMFEEYREQIKSDYADLKNSGGRPAGTITAGWFLREFVGDTPWAHLDVAGTAYGDGKLSYQTKGSTGAPTRLFVDWVLARAG